MPEGKCSGGLSHVQFRNLLTSFFSDMVHFERIGVGKSVEACFSGPWRLGIAVAMPAISSISAVKFSQNYIEYIVFSLFQNVLHIAIHIWDMALAYRRWLYH